MVGLTGHDTRLSEQELTSLRRTKKQAKKLYEQLHALDDGLCYDLGFRDHDVLAVRFIMERSREILEREWFYAECAAGREVPF